MGNTPSVTVSDSRPLTTDMASDMPGTVDRSSVVDTPTPRPDYYSKPKSQHLTKDYPRKHHQTADQNQVHDNRKVVKVYAEKLAGDQNPQRRRYWSQTSGPDMSQRKQIWFCYKGRLGYRKKEESESWTSYTDAVLRLLLENLRKESDDVVLSALSMPYDEYKHLLYLAYPWLKEVEKTAESSPQGAPGMHTWSLKGPAFDEPCRKCERAGVHCEAKSIDCPVHEPGGRQEIRGLRCKQCIMSKDCSCDAWMHCWNGTRPVRGRPRAIMRQNDNDKTDVNTSILTTRKRKRTDFASEYEDDEALPERSVAENGDEPVQSLRSGVVDFVRQLQCRITALEQEKDLLKQENAHLVQSVVELRMVTPVLQVRMDAAVQATPQEEPYNMPEGVISKKTTDNNTRYQKRRPQGDGVLNAATWRGGRGG
ncbi:uncharacterized protein EV420DRAFT_1567789 [Desarmillaria tabescens]|uniref:Uncharacterized protein n=1 Tax=Armillaria tabescens TaxID=1929756 RepID=A0AA39JS88_ARMTA|nr:uncharacterized protein EV420DRAFT_1567789 [Desarmillaria tabescens]KAK0447824.1 hypothetical protein EV420DRAFT_1567789 [Desarmillaria tabescens]